VKTLKWSAITIGSLAGLCLILVGGGLFWGYFELRKAMVPEQPDAPVPSLTNFIEDDPQPPSTSALATTQNISSIAALMEGEARRPWTRWWWPGGDISAEKACEQLATFESIGFGGVEIQAFNAGLMYIDDQDTQTRINSFGSEAYLQKLREVMQCARDIGMDVYLNHLSGWPAGGPEVPVDEGMKELTFAETRVTGGRAVSLTLPQPEPTYNDYIMALGERLMGFDLTNFVDQDRELLSVVAGRPVSGKRSGNPMHATDTIELDPTTLTILTDKVTNGQLLWEAPEGEWHIVAIYIQPSGEAPTLIASARSGFVIDHFDTDIVRGHYGYAFGERTGLDAYYGDPLKGFFNDSLEFKVARFASADVLDEFMARRGYDLEPYLPVVFRPARDNFFITETMRHRPADDFRLTDDDARMQHDYQQTISDLIIERFVETSAEWAAARGLVSKGQSYGADFDVIRAMGQTTMPESEQLFGGGSEVVLKMASASGDLYGKPVISAESFVWYKLAYGVTPAQLKLAADKLFVSGINQIVYHGIPYQPDGQAYEDYFGELDWYPFAGPQNDSNFSGNYGPTSPIWPVIPELNDYLKRVQTLLQAGRQTSDVFIYYPFLGFPHEIEDSEAFEEDFLFMGSMPGEAARHQAPPMEIPLVKLPEMTDEERKDYRLKWLEQVKPLIDVLNSQGISWTWINDDRLSQVDVVAGETAQIILANAPTIERSSVESLASWTGANERLFFWRSLPDRQPGFLNHEGNDAFIQSTLQNLSARQQFEDPGTLVSQLQSRLSIANSTQVRRYTRTLDDGKSIHFLFNQSTEEKSFQISSAETFPHAYWYDASTGSLTAADRSDAGGYELTLDGLETVFLIQSPEPMSDPVTAAVARPADNLPLDHWTLTVGDVERDIQGAFPDLRNDSELRHNSGPAVYTAQLEIPELAACACRYVLDLDNVAGAAMVSLNGQTVGSISLPPFQLDLTEQLKSGENLLEISVRSPLRNQLVGRALAGDKQLHYMTQHEYELSQMGLLGKARLIEQSIESE
tara:strand:+ start:11614 stop:14703 length:3090 start_codon:yes stop_codon:yes gene_type:complete